MTLVVLPFRYDDLAVFDRTLSIAAAHRAVSKVLCIGDLPPQPHVLEAAARVAANGLATVEVIRQDRIGSGRPGKGDALLTGLQRFAGRPGPDRIHFYDTDIRTFSSGWIDVAEKALNAGADVAKHFFHRTPTDAQITWHVTKPGAALLWPDSRFPDIHQPLGGEFALTRRGAEAIWASPHVRERSDWGIDTVLTFEMIRQGLSIHEVFVPEGKEHGYYGSLLDLRGMLCECLDALQRLATVPLPEDGTHRIDGAGEVPEVVRSRVAYDIEASHRLLEGDVSPDAQAILEAYPALVLAPIAAWTDGRWEQALRSLLDGFRLGDSAWEEIAFRAWVSRVLFHTSTNVPLGYEAAMAALQSAVDRFRSNRT